VPPEQGGREEGVAVINAVERCVPFTLPSPQPLQPPSTPMPPSPGLQPLQPPLFPPLHPAY
jgi:hypothetical protein